MSRPRKLTDEQRKANDAARSRKWRAEHPEQSKKQWAAWYKKYPVKNLLCKVKSRAVRKEVIFDLQPEDITFPEVCPVLGIPMNYTDKTSDGYPNLDRIVPEKGYIAGNVQVISYRANRIKQDGSAEEHMQIAAYIQHATGEESV